MSLRERARAKGIEFGSAVGLPAFTKDSAYADLLARECGVLVAENASKFGPICPERGAYQFDKFDSIVEFAERNETKLRGHTLVWHNQAPDWLNAITDPAELTQALRDHFRIMLDRYRGKIESWDVVNEGVADDGTMRDTHFLRVLGMDYLAFAFREAHALDATIELVYNDYSIEEITPKSDRVFELVRDLRAEGVPVHAVGFQAHLMLAEPPNLDSVRQNFKRFRDLGVKLLVTEMDIRIPEPFTSEKRAEQAALYEGFINVCLEAGMERIVLWGITDRYSWVPGFFTGTGEALVFDQDLQPKPAYDALMRCFT